MIFSLKGFDAEDIGEKEDETEMKIKVIRSPGVQASKKLTQ